MLEHLQEQLFHARLNSTFCILRTSCFILSRVESHGKCHNDGDHGALIKIFVGA